MYVYSITLKITVVTDCCFSSVGALASLLQMTTTSGFNCEEICAEKKKKFQDRRLGRRLAPGPSLLLVCPGLKPISEVRTR